MAQDQLTAAARAGVPRVASQVRTGQVIIAGAILAGGVLAEIVAPGPVTLLTGADFAVGACYAAVGARLLRACRRDGAATASPGGPAQGWLALGVSAA
jgi:hypothetical protein